MIDESVEQKLLALCDKQLDAAISDAESSISRVTENLMYSVRAISILSDSLGEESKLSAPERSLFALMEKHLNGVLANLQFFDEFHQRVSHVREVLELLGRADDGVLECAAQDERKGVESLLKGIFSIRAEYETMRELFPHIEQEKNDNSVELF